ncbi:MAG TPA: hypothetical protein VFM29_02090, partial [Vicinamibacteria bacterium]|nr:hypothetical protein [Vicinamibacteria bacterium]
MTAPAAVPIQFRARARAAVADHQLDVALGRATAQLGSRRATALASLPFADSVRDRARHAKMEVLRDLAGHL